MRTLKKAMLLGLCGAMIATTLPYHDSTHTEKVYAANDTFSVTPKENTSFFVNQNILVSQFVFSLNRNTVNTDNVTISPSVFTSSGTKDITIIYDTGSTVYQQKLSIEVEEIVPDHLELSSSDITLVKGQTISPETLPDVYLYYNNGTKELLTDYTTEIDWEQNLLAISSNGFTLTQNVNVIDSNISYIQVFSKKSIVPSNYEFVKDDLVVTAYFADGSSIVVDDYQIFPYTLTTGNETIITVKYLTVTGSFIVRSIAPSQAPTKQETTNTVAPIPTMLPNTTTFPNTTTTSETPDTTATPTEIPTTITLEKSVITQGIGEKVKVKVKTTPETAISLRSKNKKIATVTKKNYIKGTGKGKTKIIVTAGTAQTIINVTVCPAPTRIGVTSTLASSTSCVLKNGTTSQIPIYFNKGAYSNKITFRSSKKSVASVSSKGKISAKKVGKTTIRISSFNKKKATLKVKVIK